MSRVRAPCVSGQRSSGTLAWATAGSVGWLRRACACAWVCVFGPRQRAVVFFSSEGTFEPATASPGESRTRRDRGRATAGAPGGPASRRAVGFRGGIRAGRRPSDARRRRGIFPGEGLNVHKDGQSRRSGRRQPERESTIGSAEPGLAGACVRANVSGPGALGRRAREQAGCWAGRQRRHVDGSAGDVPCVCASCVPCE